MHNISFGNATQSDPKRRGWILGNFIDSKMPMHSKDVEIKWAVLKRGEDKSIATANRLAKSISILVKGNVNFFFPDSGERIELKKEGDYVYWDNEVFHTTEIVEDSIVITVRWPSVTDDAYTK